MSCPIASIVMLCAVRALTSVYLVLTVSHDETPTQHITPRYILVFVRDMIPEMMWIYRGVATAVELTT
jgi:hypothetical protein